MQARKYILKTIALTVIVVILVAIVFIVRHKQNADALWKIVSEQCVPGQQVNHNPAPCVAVNFRNGSVVMKDRHGVLQYLLMPVSKITGIESPQLLNPATTNFFAEAWRARHYMQQLRGLPVSDRAVSLTINSPTGRSQNQLHIHISCLRVDVRRQLDSLNARLNERWQTIQLLGHAYQVRRVSRDEMKKISPFIRIASELPGAREEMGKYSIAVAELSAEQRVLMVTKRDWLKLNRASAEELQDHDCQILNATQP